MRAVGFKEFGDPEVLEVMDIPEVSAGPGEIRIKNYASAVNPTDIVSRSGLISQFRKDFEEMVKAKKRHRLDLDRYINNTASIKTNNLITDQLKKLNDLYKSGVLTKEEFEKAKKKILN